MSKVICDVCGTTYPETAAQCPICGSAKNNSNQTAAGTADNAEAASASYAYVKGGRFSKKNVRRRSKGVAPATTAQRRSERSSRSMKGNDEPNNTGLVIVVILLMLAIVAVLFYIGVHFFNSDDPSDNTNPSGSTGTSQTDGSTGSTQGQQIPCTDLKLSNGIIEFTNAGDSWQLKAELTPVDTTDVVRFESSDPSIATVADDGTVTAVAGGTTTILVTCGEQSANCVINCNFGKQGGDDPEPGVFEFEFNTPFTDSTTGYGDTTLSAQGATWKAYKSSLDIDPSLITWTSDNPSICTIDKGVVTAVAPGTTKVHAQYNGITYTCVVRCSFTLEDVTGDCTISHKDVTIAVGESFNLKLKDAVGYTLDVQWACDGDGVSIEGNKITGVASGVWKVYVTYEDVTYTCTVRVK